MKVKISVFPKTYVKLIQQKTVAITKSPCIFTPILYNFLLWFFFFSLIQFTLKNIFQHFKLFLHQNLVSFPMLNKIRPKRLISNNTMSQKQIDWTTNCSRYLRNRYVQSRKTRIWLARQAIDHIHNVSTRVSCVCVWNVWDIHFSLYKRKRNWIRRTNYYYYLLSYFSAE